MNFFIIFIILVSTDLILFNEEFLILLCFCIFCIFCITNLKLFINQYFDGIFLNIEKNTKTSYNKTIISLNKEINWLKNIKSINKNFLNLKSFYLNLNKNFLNSTKSFQKSKICFNFNNKLMFINNIENQIKKTIIIFLLFKIKEIIKIRLFYKNKMKSFNCLNKVLLLEYIKKI